ncbi:hypothetical protein NE237_004496 [Protea cynaroides]|uniref:Uncharacterized protein n=1 Tax=Protea cynaroides TaxID=273540 RepID=A0A9Q0QTN3_9MAGN|nr:hypothetical protein NE237_004496 [Protea cynaroides]
MFKEIFSSSSPVFFYAKFCHRPNSDLLIAAAADDDDQQSWGDWGLRQSSHFSRINKMSLQTLHSAIVCKPPSPPPSANPPLSHICKPCIPPLLPPPFVRPLFLLCHSFFRHHLRPPFRLCHSGHLNPPANSPFHLWPLIPPPLAIYVLRPPFRHPLSTLVPSSISHRAFNDTDLDFCLALETRGVIIGNKWSMLIPG